MPLTLMHFEYNIQRKLLELNKKPCLVHNILFSAVNSKECEEVM